MRKPNETALVRDLLRFLELVGIPAWRQNTGAVAAEHNGKRRFVRFGVKGCSDILGIIPPVGRFLAVEAKVAPNRPTEDQLNFLANVREAGGIGLVCYSVADLQASLTEEEVIP